MNNNNKTPLLGMSLNQLKEIVTLLKMPTFTASQISDWLYKKRITEIDDMTNISAMNRLILKEKYYIGRQAPLNFQESVDGTKKYLFKTEANNFIESVYIPEEDRFTLCVSSQVGCKMACTFCMTGRQGFVSQLSSGQILNQIMSIDESEKLTNIVFMGMGEPFDNTLNVLKALEILTAPYGFGWSAKRITVSTSGLIPGMKVFIEKSNCHLALSLHTPFPEERAKLMPVEQAYSLPELLNVIRKTDFSHQRRVSFEYIMFEGFNDTIRHAVELVKILRGIDCRINLIRFHAIPGSELKTTDEVKMIFFRDYLANNGIICTIRKSRGEDIFAACGMLSTSEQEKLKLNDE
jgi:23S rRNA (adenine2503-C2)-methyltransferase